MEKRLVLAIALSLLVLLTWSALIPKPQVIDNKGITATNSQLQAVPRGTSSFSQLPELTQSTPDIVKETVKFTQDGREIIFNPAKADILEVVFKDKQIGRAHV